MERSVGAMLKGLGVAFVLIVVGQVAVPAPALASCICGSVSHTTPPYQAIEPTCEGAMNELNEFFADPEGQTCGGFDACGQQVHITQACFQRPDGQYEIDGYERFWCQSGTTCP
jgi:hypothetical protein